ncbi:MAG: cyanophycin synthetase, partial [Paracoccaceae bacterium]|nr:cyanophycin synthetase [Paracoccaceae bacterium]
ILPADLPVTPILIARAARAQANTVLFGTAADADYRLGTVTLTPEATIARFTHKGSARLFKISTPGRHFAANALAVLACADVLGLDPTITTTDLGRWAPPAGRGSRERITIDAVEGHAFHLIDDAFNANPASLAAALDLLAVSAPTNGIGRVALGRRIAILGDMLELGPTETALHEEIARHPALAAIDIVHCVGPRMRALHDALPKRKRGLWVATATDLLPRAHTLVDAGDIVLVKGSKGIRVSLVVDALRKLRQAGAAQDQGAE